MVTESQAKTILMNKNIEIPKGVSARETLAQNILDIAGKPKKQGSTAIESLIAYRLSAYDDASTKTLEDAYSAFLNLGEIPAPAPTP